MTEHLAQARRKLTAATTVLIAVALTVALAAALVLRTLRHRARTAHDREVHMFPNPAQSYAGPQYEVHFYDDQYRQLTDLNIWVGLPVLHGPAADAALDQLARALAAEVDRRDSQRCFRPRLVVLGADGQRLRGWTVTG
jgi:hypothetical protein